MENDESDEESDGDTEDEATLCEPHYNCFCGNTSSEEMVACDNVMCSRKWFHLHCVNLVVTPDENEQ
ncbi:hypothetical protein EJ04DRAFT_446703 [Polyplosphaeria fusca]|uniref:PHD-type domain-containing protein n=1 Tax=Polyplosphaeria fusca TaxID=682080 RepID=A0A9P4UWV6_9PLEO|nr:hypothetical protein EJ04DRAFT_446703 [Polyplosphaeria fusca]